MFIFMNLLKGVWLLLEMLRKKVARWWFQICFYFHPSLGKRLKPPTRLVCGHQTCWIEVFGWKAESTTWFHYICWIEAIGWRNQSSLEGVVHGVWMKVWRKRSIIWREAANQRKLFPIDFSKRQEQAWCWCKFIWIDLLQSKKTCFFFLAWQRPFRTSQRSRSEQWRKLISYRSYLLIDQTCKQLQWLWAAVALHCRKVFLYNQPAIISLLQNIYQTRRSAWSEEKIYYLYNI